MDLRQYLTEARGHYVQMLAVAMADVRRQHPELLGEVLCVGEVPAGMQVAEGFRLGRQDLIRKPEDGGAPQVIVMELVHSLPEGPGEFAHASGPKISVQSLRWDDATISFSCAAFPSDAVVRWFTKWLKSDDSRVAQHASGQGLLGVVHRITPPISRGSRHYFTVDFGSGPVEAFEELVDVLLAAGATRMRIASSVSR